MLLVSCSSLLWPLYPLRQCLTLLKPSNTSPVELVLLELPVVKIAVGPLQRPCAAHPPVCTLTLADSRLILQNFCSFTVYGRLLMKQHKHGLLLNSLWIKTFRVCWRFHDCLARETKILSAPCPSTRTLAMAVAVHELSLILRTVVPPLYACRQICTTLATPGPPTHKYSPHTRRTGRPYDSNCQKFMQEEIWHSYAHFLLNLHFYTLYNDR